MDRAHWGETPPPHTQILTLVGLDKYPLSSPRHTSIAQLILLAHSFFGLVRGGSRVFREGPGSPRNPDGWPWVASRGTRGPGARVKNHKIQYFLFGPTGRPSDSPLHSALTWTQGQILDFSFSVPLNRSPELICVELCSVFQAGAVGQAPRPNFGRKPAKNREKLKYIYIYIYIFLSFLF